MFAIRTALCSLLVAVPGMAAPQGTFELLNVSVSNGDSWKLNREIEFLFNDPLDLTTVNANSVQLRDAGGLPVLGDFYLRAPRELVFQPTCPTQEDLSDGGFMQGMTYSLILPTGGPSGVLHSRFGDALGIGAQLSFSIPDLNTLPDLFDDGGDGAAEVLVQPADADGSFIETGDGDRQYFQGIALGLSGIRNYATPLNLISDEKTRATVHVRMNQPLANFPWNLTMDRVRLEYKDLSGAWHPLSTSVELIQACHGGNSTLALTAKGVLPQGREVRVYLSEALQDLIGQQQVTAHTYLRFRTSKAQTNSGVVLDVIDEVREDFHLGSADENSLQDGAAVLEYPSANWGSGQLTASTNFLGDGGPDGTFDYHIPTGVDVVFSTISQAIAGGPGGFNTHQVVVLNGELNIRDLYVSAGSTLRFQGPNGVKILASGDVRIDGTVSLNGSNAKSVFSLNNPSQPEVGAPGQCGGGQGGTGSFLTTSVTPFGGNGRGAFGVVDGGGQGGESGWSYSYIDELRRPGGGGGGRFGQDQMILWGDVLCADESVPGLDAESGFPGSEFAISSQDGGTHFPYGGHAGPSPFPNGDPRDDFFGRARLSFLGPNAQLVQGELPHAWAGSGGGAGGDASRLLVSETYPPATMANNRQDKGAGGGGGAGSIEIYCLGDVVFGANGKLTAVGGHGNGGENTSGVNRIGGGSGGGSGGHIIVHAGGQIDLSMVPPGSFAIDAKGGQGGEGASTPGGGNHGSGGAFVGESLPYLDARHVGANLGQDNPWITGLLLCQRYWLDLFAPLTPTKVIHAAGGDGGPGVVQLHVNSLAGPDNTHDVRYPATGSQADLARVIRPVPVGYDLHQGAWRDHLLPDLGPLSQAQSKWISVGVPQAAPNSATPDLLRFLFEGTDPATGMVTATGGIVDSLPALLAPSNLPESPGLPNLAGSDGIHFDPSSLPAPYQANPSALVGFVVERGGSLRTVQTAEIRFDGIQDVLSLTMDGAWPVPPVGGPVTLQPRFFRVAGALNQTPVPHALPAGMSVRVEFQAAPATAAGEVDASNIVPSASTWSTDVAELTNSGSNADLRFVRFRVTFDLEAQAGGSLLDASLYLDLLKLTFQF